MHCAWEPHLAALLQSGIALDLPDGSQLTVGALRPESPWVGRAIQSRTLSGPIVDAKIVAVLRGKSVLLARPETILQPADRLLLITPPQAQEALARHLVPPPALDSQTDATGAF
jgi:Trk K+ transport system NAD-binding subunit